MRQVLEKFFRNSSENDAPAALPVSHFFRKRTREIGPLTISMKIFPFDR